MAMLLGKRRHRQSMRRTTSLTELSSNHLPLLEPDTQTCDPPSPMQVEMEPAAPPAQRAAGSCPVADGKVRPQVVQDRQQKEKGPRANPPSDDWLGLGFFPPAPPRGSRRNSGDFGVEPAHFLRACGLCRRRLGPGRDTYMYRGEIAFCSLECRQQQMALDERKDKCSRASMRANGAAAAVQATAAAAAAASKTTSAAAGTAATAGGTAAAA